MFNNTGLDNGDINYLSFGKQLTLPISMNFPTLRASLICVQLFYLDWVT